MTFNYGRMICLVSKIWNTIGVGARDISNVIVVLNHQFQEKSDNKDLTEL